jgi:ABC-type amino acid transport substrate-binding protein
LRVCLEADNPPFSSESDPRRGLDYEIAELVAAAMSRPLEIHWYSASMEEDFPLPLQINALLSDGQCHLAGGYPLTQDGLGDPSTEKLRGTEPNEKPYWIRLNALLATLPYMSLPLALISADRSANTTDLDLDRALEGRLAVEAQSFANAIAIAHTGPRRQAAILALPDDAIFEAVASGAADYAFIEVHRFEIFHAHHPKTALSKSDYRHGLAINTGMAGIAPELLEEVSRAIQYLLEAGQIAEVVEAYGLSYHPPTRPAVLPPITARLLAQ